MDHCEIFLVLARAENGVIGRNGKLPWHIPADLRHFKELTLEKPMIMGRKTFDSLPGLLSDRRHIILTRNTDWQGDGVDVAHDLNSAIRLANAPHIAVIGGAEIYRLFLPIANQIELTEVHADVYGETTIDTLDTAIWHETTRASHEAQAGNPGYSFVTYSRAAS